MKRTAETPKRPKLQITLPRAARLYRLVALISEGGGTRESILSGLSVGLRTFYRELELLKKCGIRVRQTGKAYELQAVTVAEAQGRLPFPDPQLSFAEMSELASYPGAASTRLSKLFETVIKKPETKPKRQSRKESGSGATVKAKGKKGK